MTPPQSQTPETDALIIKLHNDCPTILVGNVDAMEHQFVMIANHARSLEKRLNEVLANLERYGGVITNRNERVDNLLAERTSLLVQIALKDEALKRALSHLDSIMGDTDSQFDESDAMKLCQQLSGALTNSPAAAQEMVERMERMEKALEKLARLGNEPMFGNSVGNDIAREALSPLKTKV